MPITILNKSRLVCIFVFSITLLGGHHAVAQPPAIDRIDPPNWWIGMKWQPLQLMISGKNLSDATIESNSPDLLIRRVQISANGSYAFVDVELSDSATAQNYELTISNGNGHTSCQYPFFERDSQQPRHQGFNQSDVIYLITPDRFSNGDVANDQLTGYGDFDRANSSKRHGGDLAGIQKQLSYLKQLGVTTLWLNPVLENKGRSSYHGYAITDHYLIDPRFGSNAKYQELVNRCHAEGIKVIFDHVNNHVGINHPWVRNPPAADWFNGTREEHHRQKHYLHSISDPHASANAVELLTTFWFVDGMPDLNQRNKLLANYLIQNTLWWIEFGGIDGIREDTYPYNDQAFMSRWCQAILKEYPNFNIVGEIWSPQPAYISLFQDGSKFPGDLRTHLPSVMDFPLMESWRRFLRGDGKLMGVYESYSQDFVYPDWEKLVVFLDNHDVSRAIFHARDDQKRFKLALTVLMFARGIPQILYGTEIGMLGGATHVELRADFPGGFPGDRSSAFGKASRTKRQTEFFEFCQKLLKLRSAHPALHGGKMIHFAPSFTNDTYKILKVHQDESILVVANGNSTAITTDTSELAPYLKSVELLKDLMTDEIVPVHKLTVPALTARVLLVDPKTNESE